MRNSTKLGGGLLLSVMILAGHAPAAHAYGPEGLFGGRPQPDSTIVLGNPVELRNDRPERTESVIEHPRPDYDPAPISVGSFELFPSLELGETYDSNIFAQKNGERDDAIGTIRPIVNLFSNWGRHALSVTTFGDINYFSQHPDENYSNGVLDINGRYDVMNQMWLSGRAGYQRLAESRSSPDNQNGSQPTTFGLGKAGLGLYRGVGKVKVNADYDFKRFDYDNVPSTNGTIDESGRNRVEHLMGGKVGYDLSGNVKPYVKGDYNVRTYDHTPLRNSDGFNALLGTTMDFGGITSVDFFAGYMAQFYDNFTTKKVIASPRAGARLDWNVTGMTSLVLEADRTIEETTLAGFNSYYSTGGSATLTHELRRNILLEANYSFTRADFNGLGSRQDDDMSAGAGMRYLINRNLYTDLFYAWSNRNSDAANVDYNRHQATVRLGVRL